VRVKHIRKAARTHPVAASFGGASLTTGPSPVQTAHLHRRSTPRPARDQSPRPFPDVARFGSRYAAHTVPDIPGCYKSLFRSPLFRYPPFWGLRFVDCDHDQDRLSRGTNDVQRPARRAPDHQAAGAPAMLRIVLKYPARPQRLEHFIECDPFLDHLRLGMRGHPDGLRRYFHANLLGDPGPIPEFQPPLSLDTVF